MQLHTEAINEVYQGLDAAAANSRANVASLEKQKSELVDLRKIDGSRLPLLTRLYQLEAELARLQVDRDLAERIYVEVARRYEVERLHVAGPSAEVDVIDPAVPADRAMSRHVTLKTVLGIVVGLCVAMVAVVVWQATVEARQRRMPAP